MYRRVTFQVRTLCQNVTHHVEILQHFMTKLQIQFTGCGIRIILVKGQREGVQLGMDKIRTLRPRLDLSAVGTGRSGEGGALRERLQKKVLT